MNKKVLLVCDQNPIPRDGGANIRSMLFADYFARRGQVDLVYTDRPRKPINETGPFRNIHFIEKQRSSEDGIIATLRGIMTGLPYYVRTRRSRQFELEFGALVRANQYDVVVLRYLFDAHCFFPGRGLDWQCVVVDVDDVPTGSLYTLLYQIPSTFWLKRQIDWLQVRAYSRKCLTVFPHLLFCTQSDIDDFSKYATGNTSNCRVIPNVISADPWDSYDVGDGFANEGSLLFVGALSYRVNIEGLEWFIQEVFLQMRRSRPEMILTVVGKGPTPDVVKMCDHDGISLKPDVPDVRPYYESAKALVVPVLRGSGTRLKILESALSRRPILTTAIGVQGLILEENRDVLVFKDVVDFAQHWQELENRQRYMSLVENAEAVVREHYSLSSFFRALDRIGSDEDLW